MGAQQGVDAGSAARPLNLRWASGWLSSPWTIRWLMAVLILAIVLPLLAFSAFLVLRSAEHEQALMGQAVRERVQATAATIDYDISLLRARLFLLAGSRHLQANDLTAFHAEASEVAESHGLHVILADPAGQELVNTGVPFGTHLPIAPDLDAVKQVAATDQPNVSDLAVDPTTKELFIAINVPVMRDGVFAYVLSFDIAPRIPSLLARLDLHPGWVVALSDRRGYIIARNHDVGHAAGQLGRPEFLDQFRAAPEGWFPGVSREGLPVYNAYTRMRLAGWTIDIAIPDHVLFAPVHRSTLILALLGGAVVCIALILASFIGRRVARPIGALVTYAQAVGRGERLPLRLAGIEEIDAVAHSLDQAAQQIQRGTEERDLAAAQLRASERKYRDLAQALAAANEERTQLLHQIVTTQEAERTRIARELHDRLGQYLTALLLGLDAIQPACAEHPAARQRLAALKDLTGQLGKDFSRMAWELRPMALDELGLRNAIKYYLEEWADRSGLRIDLEITLGDRRLPPDAETALFRVLQEAITNVLKHSGADRIGVILESIGGEVRLIVEDNGRGFDSESSVVSLDTTHLGLLGVRERLALVNGRLQVESAPDSGTTVYACVPIAEGMDE